VGTGLRIGSGLGLVLRSGLRSGLRLPSGFRHRVRGRGRVIEVCMSRQIAAVARKRAAAVDHRLVRGNVEASPLHEGNGSTTAMLGASRADLAVGGGLLEGAAPHRHLHEALLEAQQHPDPAPTPQPRSTAGHVALTES